MCSSSRSTEEGDREAEADLPPAEPQEDGCSCIGSQCNARRRGARQLSAASASGLGPPPQGHGLHWCLINYRCKEDNCY